MDVRRNDLASFALVRRASDDSAEQGFCGAPECLEVMNELQRLGVTDFRCLIRARVEVGDFSTFPTTPSFAKGTRISAQRLEKAANLACWLGSLVADSVLESLAGTSAEGYDLLIEASVIVTHPENPREVITWVTVIASDDAEFDGHEIRLT